MTEAEYEPFDQAEHLSPPPWNPTDPALIAWEKAHGHDVRIKCYPEFGCLVIEKALERQLNIAEVKLAKIRALLLPIETDAECVAAVVSIARILDGNNGVEVSSS